MLIFYKQLNCALAILAINYQTYHFSAISLYSGQFLQPQVMKAFTAGSCITAAHM